MLAYEPIRRLPVFVAGSHTEGPDYRVVRPHGASDYLLFVTQSGQGRLRLGGRDIPIDHDTAVLLRPESAHDYGTSRQGDHWSFHWVHFMPRVAWVDWLKWPEIGPGASQLQIGSDTTPVVVQALARVQQHTNTAGRFARDLGLNALEQAILELNAGRVDQESGRADARIRRLLRYIATDLTAPHSVESLAHGLGLSTSRFTTLFRQEVGLSPQRYLEELRLERARQLLEVTDLPVRRVAEDVGFPDPNYFSTRFRRRYGTSPRAFRSLPPAL